MNQEKWKQYKTSSYWISDQGRVKSCCYAKERIMRFYLDADRYAGIKLYVDNVYESWKVHRLVMYVFKGFSSLEVNHKNFNRSDNRLSNLEYLIHKKNAVRGERHGHAVLNLRQVKKIKKFLEVFSIKHVAQMFNVSWKIIWRIKIRETWVV